MRLLIFCTLWVFGGVLLVSACQKEEQYPKLDKVWVFKCYSGGRLIYYREPLYQELSYVGCSRDSCTLDLAGRSNVISSSADCVTHPKRLPTQYRDEESWAVPYR